MVVLSIKSSIYILHCHWYSVPLACENKEENNVCSSLLKLYLHVEEKRLKMTSSVSALR